MKIKLEEIFIREIFSGYVNNEEEGVVGYNGNLNIRPPYQREFIYKSKQKEAVIETIKKGFPLNVMYWVENSDKTFEILDGQQRTISFCEYLQGNFSVKNYYFHSLTEIEQQEILDYKLMVYICEGNDREKLDWFETINIAGEKLTSQELRNAIYMGKWITEAKKYFSKNGCVAFKIGRKYLKGSSIRQDYLETAIKWINKGNIEGYMAKHQHEKNASALWLYFQAVINWVNTLFTNYRREMQGIEWGVLYNEFKDKNYNPKELEEKIKKLMEDEEVEKKSGIYNYIFDGQERHLKLRAFSKKIKREVYEQQQGICEICQKKFSMEEMEADHITPWSDNGKTEKDNCQMLCKECNRRKSGK